MSGTALWRWKAVLILGMIGALLGFLDGSWGRTRLLGAEHASGPRLVAVEFLPESNGDVCEWSPAGANVSLSVASQQGAVSPRTVLGEDTRLSASQRKPLRVIRDPYPAYSAIAVDPIRNEVVVTDNNFFQILVYDRLANTPPTASRTDPKRVLGGLAEADESSSIHLGAESSWWPALVAVLERPVML